MIRSTPPEEPNRKNSVLLADNGSIGKMPQNSDFPAGNSTHGLLAELADAMDSKSIPERGIGSSPIEAIGCGNPF
jgi:hypothetical protein